MNPHVVTRNWQTNSEPRLNLARDGADGIRITELAGRIGTTPRAIRYYEELNLITPHRTRAGARTYCPDTRRTLEIIVTLRRAGVPIDQIRCILADPTNREHLNQKVSSALRVRLRDLQCQIDDLKSLLSQFGAVKPTEPVAEADTSPRQCCSGMPDVMRN